MPENQPLHRWPAYRIVGLSSTVLTALGFCGLWFCKCLRERHGLSEHQFMETAAGHAATWVFAESFSVGLFLLFPLSVSLQKRAGVPIAGLAGTNVPKRISWPVLGLAMLIIGFLLSGSAGFLIW